MRAAAWWPKCLDYKSIAVGVSEENNNMDRIPNNTSLYKDAYFHGGMPIFTVNIGTWLPMFT